MKLWFLTCALFLVLAVMAQDNDKNIQQQLSTAIAQKDFKTAALHSATLANTTRKTGDVLQTLRYDSLTLLYARLIPDSALVLRTINSYASELFEMSRAAAADALLEEGKSYLAASVIDEIRWYKVKGFGQFKRFKMDAAIEEYKAGLAKAQQAGITVEEMNLKWLVGNARVYKGKADSMHLVYEALAYFERTKHYGLASGAAASIARSFLFAFNPAKAEEYYQKALEFARLAQDEAKVMTYREALGDVYIAQKKFAEAEQQLKAVEQFARSKSDYIGIATANIHLGRVMTESGRLNEADAYFEKAATAAKRVGNPILTASLNGYWFVLKAKQKNFKSADSLGASAITGIGNFIDKQLLKESAQKLKEGGHITAVDTLEVINAFKAKASSATSTLMGLTEEDYEGLLKLNPYSGTATKLDSTVLQTNSKTLLSLEAEHNISAVSDSLQIKKEESKLLWETVKQRNLVVIGTVVLLALVSLGLWLQYRNRQRAERDKARIELLQNEIHHRVKNNLAVINRLVDVSGKASLHETSVDVLKTRIKSIELLHRHLYDSEAQAGNISLKPYLQDLCAAIAATFETDKAIAIDVKSDAEVDSAVAEKLGLIVNELVTNSFKYAFPQTDFGNITVQAVQAANGLRLVVADNGIGMPTEKVKGSYGMKLIKGLSHELNGTFAFQNNGGTQFHLTVPL